MGTLFRFSILMALKALSHVLFRVEVSWVGPQRPHPFRGASIGIFLNHTSLLEPIFLSALSPELLWQLARHGVFPGADITLNRPIVGFLFRVLMPNAVSVTRKRDESWDQFLDCIGPESRVVILPEGRMMRANGLDKFGKPMTVRGGVADVLLRLNWGTIIFAYSGGLHHVLAPGDKFPRLFQKIRIAFEVVEVLEYRRQVGHEDDPKAFRLAVIADLERRRDSFCPK